MAFCFPGWQFVTAVVGKDATQLSAARYGKKGTLLFRVCPIRSMEYIVGPTKEGFCSFFEDKESMLRWEKVILATLFALLLPVTVHAKNLKLTGGAFQFEHAPVAPPPDAPPPEDLCFDDGGVPFGFLYSVTSDNFTGVLEQKNGPNLPFAGAGDATGCVFFAPLENGAVAEFFGSFTWHLVGGDLSGTFQLLDFPGPVEGVFQAVVFITIDGGTGEYSGATGEAIAEGLDFPFGGLNRDQESAGVVAEIIEGKIKVNAK
jgi:hypothetical protein